MKQKQANTFSDKQLMESIATGNHIAFSTLYDKYAEALFKYGHVICADEALIQDHVQDLFIYIWNKRTQLTHVKVVKDYLFNAFRNNLIKGIHQKKRTILAVINDENIKSKESDWILIEQQENLSKLLKNSMNELPDRQHEILHLKYYQGLSNLEIAKLLNINPQSVSNTIYRALNGLRKKIKNN